ncbi:MAG: AraC family transcriptional regulator [Bryobacterales bacterium]|nr:AraC family transcriptional regulator [Bryobacterales bacterium]
MDIEVTSRHTRGASGNLEDEGFPSRRPGGPHGADPLLRDNINRKDWKFYDIQLSPNTSIPVLSECASTIALIVDRSPGAAIEDSVQAAACPGDISLSIGAQLQRLSFTGRIHLYLLVVDRSCMLRLSEGDVDTLPCVFIPTVYVRDSEIKHSMQALREHLYGDSAGGRMYCEAYANSIVLRALRRAGCVPLHSPDYKDPLTSATLTTVLDYMYSHLADTTSRSDTLAHVAALPVDVFRHRFRKSLRKSVHQCLIDIRLEIAENHLSRTSRPVSQIALDTGFADHSHFSKVFRNRTGTTPSEFREIIRGKKET